MTETSPFARANRTPPITSNITTVFEGENEIPIKTFQPFYDEVSTIALADAKEGSKSDSPYLTLRYTFDDDSADTVEFYADEDNNNKYTAVVNGSIIGHARKSDVTRVIDDLKKIKATP